MVKIFFCSPKRIGTRNFKFILSLLLILHGLQSFSQKMEGVYFGYILSERNALVIKSNGPSWTGSIYLNKTESLNVVGTIKNNLLTGSIRLSTGKEIFLQGELIKSSLSIKVSADNMPGIRHLLNKISSNEKYNMDRLFSQQYDPMLFGRWETIKEFDSYGISTEGGKVVLEFDSNGYESVQIITLPEKFKDVGSSSANNPFKRMEFRWSTEGNKLYSTMKLLQGEKSDFGYYAIKSDTLYIYATNGAVTLFKKK